MVSSKPIQLDDCHTTTAAPARDARQALLRGVVLPAHPLAITSERRLDERRQRALSRYYLESGAGGLAVGVHTTQFRIHEPSVGLLEPVLALAAEEMDRADGRRCEPLVRVAGICGETPQAVREAVLAKELGYEFGLVSMGALRGRTIDDLVEHCQAVAKVIDVFGFYLQPKVGGVGLPLDFWRRFCQIERVAAIKVAAFDRYKTFDVVRAVAESGRPDIALYTGNDDNIVVDLLTKYAFESAGRTVEQRFRGGLLGQWAVWTSNAVDLLRQCQRFGDEGTESRSSLKQWLELAIEITDANAAIFDAANDFRGCLPGIYEVLRRQGLLANNHCLDTHETLSPGQADEIDRVMAAYPHIQDDQWVAEHLDRWLSD